MEQYKGGTKMKEGLCYILLLIFVGALSTLFISICLFLDELRKEGRK